jgi:hypothetical protein
MASPAEVYLRALDELVMAMAEKDELGVRQAAEKAWLSVVRATDSWLLRRHHLRIDPDDRPHAKRRNFLRDYGKDEWSRTYSDLSQTLHGDIFYMGDSVTGARLRKYFIDAATFVEDATGADGLVDETYKRLPGGARFYDLDSG